MDGRHLSLDDATNDGTMYWEIQEEVNDVVLDCMDKIILPVTGNEVASVNLIISEE